MLDQMPLKLFGATLELEHVEYMLVDWYDGDRWHRDYFALSKVKEEDDESSSEISVDLLA